MMASKLITGFKLLLLSIVFTVVTVVYNLLLTGVRMLFGVEKWTEALSNPFFGLVALVVVIAYIFSVVYIGGWLAQAIFKWK